MKINTKKDIGNFGEAYCVKFLKRNGYKIIAQNSRLGHLETDIIATNKTHILFVEVKTRSVDKNYLLRPSDAVTQTKQSNLLKFAYYYIKTLPKKHSSKQPRMDVCEISVKDIDGKLEVCDLNYIENAFSR